MSFIACHSVVRLLRQSPAPQVMRRGGAAFLRIFAMGMVMILAANAQPPMGWIELKPLSSQNAVQIIGHALAFGEVAGVDFTLSVSRENRGNKSNSRQLGRIDLAAGETKILATASINVETGDDLTIELKMLDHGQEVFKTVMFVKPSADRKTL